MITLTDNFRTAHNHEITQALSARDTMMDGPLDKDGVAAFQLKAEKLGLG